MSSILRALERLERERQRREERPLREELALRSEAVSRAGTLRWVAGLVGAAAVGAVLVWQLRPAPPRPRAAHPPVESPPPGWRPPAASGAAAASPPAGSGAVVQGAEAGKIGPAAAPGSPAPPARSVERGRSRPRLAAATASSKRRRARAGKTRSPRSRTLRATGPEALAAPRAPTALSPPAPPAPPRAPSSPELELPPPPAVVVLSTSWHPEPGRRSAKLELPGRNEPLVLHEGDAVGSLVVTEIDPAAVVFRYGEIEIRRRVGDRR